jgi:hypothetical protein
MFGRRRAHRSTSLGAVEDWLGAWTAALAALLTAANHLCLLAFGSPLLECQRLEYCTTVGGASEAQSLPSSRRHPSFQVRAKHQLGPCCRSRTAHCTAPEPCRSALFDVTLPCVGQQLEEEAGSKLSKLLICESVICLVCPSAYPCNNNLLCASYVAHWHQPDPKNQPPCFPANRPSTYACSQNLLYHRTTETLTCFLHRILPTHAIASLSCSRIN